MISPKLLLEKRYGLRERIARFTWLMKCRPVIMGIQTIRAMVHRDANHLAAGVAYYTIFALFPFLLGVMVIADLAGTNLAQKALLEFIIGNMPGSAVFIQQNLPQIVEHRTAVVAIAIIGMLWSSSSVFEAINRVVNRAWNIRQAKPFHVSRLRHISALLIFGLLFYASVVISSGLQLLQEEEVGIPGIGQAALRLTSWWVTGITFLLIYRYLPNCRVRWRHIWLGTLIAATLFELGKVIFAWYLLTYNNYEQVYGSIASTVVFLFWVYLAAWILSLGAEICFQHRRIYYPDEAEIREDAESI